MERKSSKDYSVVFLVEGKKFKLRNLSSRNSSFFVGSAANLVCTTLEFAAFHTGPNAKYSRAVFFCPQPWFLQHFEHIF